jgi:hypothetical protein
MVFFLLMGVSLAVIRLFQDRNVQV